MIREKLEIRSEEEFVAKIVPIPQTMDNGRRKIIYPGALLLVTIGFALRLYALGRESLWFDELLQLDIAQGSLASILPQLPKHTAVPLDYLLSHFWILLGHQDTWVRLPAVIIGTLTLPVAYQLGRTMLGRYDALLLTTLLAFSPFHIHYSQEARPYVLVMLGVTLAGYAIWQFRARGYGRYLVMLLFGVLIFSLAHLFALVIFIPFLILAVTELIFGRNRRRARHLFGAIMGTGAITLVLLLLLGYGSVVYYSTREFGKAIVEPEKFTVAATQKPNQGAGPQVDESFIKNQVLGPLGSGDSAPSLWLFNGLVGLGLLYLLIQKRYRLSLLLSFWLFLPIITILAFLVYRGTFYAPRYILSTLPAYFLLGVAGILALPRWLKCAEPKWVSPVMFLVVSGLVFAALGGEVGQLYARQDNEDWRLVSRFLAQNVQPGDAVMAVNAESTLNWYYPSAYAEVDSFDTLPAIEGKVARARRSWVIMSIFSNFMGDEALRIRAWLGEQGAVRLVFDPVIDVYYLGSETSPSQLLKEIQTMALPVNHALYASLARENRRDPAVARRYYELAIESAPDEAMRAEYQAAMNALK